MGEAHGVEVVDTAGGGNCFHAHNGMLADGAVFLGGGLPQLEHGVLGEPVDLAPLEGIVMGAGEQKLEHLCVSGRRATAHAHGR